MKQILSLGAGVQSTTVLLMSIHGELPMLDAVIFADTGWESHVVYENLNWLVGVMERHGVPFHRVQAGDVKQDALTAQITGCHMRMDADDKSNAKAKGAHLNSGRWLSMPYFAIDSDGKKAMIARQCTGEYKVKPIERTIKRKILALKPRARLPKETLVRQWFGISFDERTRMRESLQAWKQNYYPLVEKRITRRMCIDWCLSHGYPEPPRSACIGCPFKSNAEWRRLSIEQPVEFADAVEFDKKIRKMGGMRGDVFLHSSCQPLGEVDFRNDYDKGQLPLWEGFINECAGVCGI